jgi:hypothetical protein
MNLEPRSAVRPLTALTASRRPRQVMRMRIIFDLEDSVRDRGLRAGQRRRHRLAGRRRRAHDLRRRDATLRRSLPLLLDDQVEFGPDEADPPEIADDRLRLIFTCCHTTHSRPRPRSR